MKKKIAVLLSLIMVFSFTMLSACGGGGGSEDLSDSKYVGTWKAMSMSFADESEDFDDEYILVVNGDGTGTFSSEKDGETSEFTWSPTDEGFKTKGDVKMTFKEDGEDLTTEMLGVELRFARAD